MGWLDRWRRTMGGGGWDGTAGRPPSGNGASSFHLFWEVPPAAGGAVLVGAEVVLEVDEAPHTDDLRFWALQVSFADAAGHPGGGAHLGLQWIAGHPGHTAVNWGGYRPHGGELRGSASALPSALGNVNTRDFAWRPGTAYRLRVRRQDRPLEGTTSERWCWAGEVVPLDTGVPVPVRALFTTGDRLTSPMVWSEVFAPCDAPGSAVRWRDPAVVDDAGVRHPVGAASVNYQSLGDGGCATTSSSVEGDAFVQRTGTARTTPQGTVLRLDGPGR